MAEEAGDSPDTGRSATRAGRVSAALSRAGVRMRRRWRVWLRGLHRDVGYLAVGLTFVYAISGVALNHVDDWNSNFKTVDRVHQLTLPLPEGEAEATREVLRQLRIKTKPGLDDFYLAGNQLEITLGKRNIIVHVDTGKAFDSYQEARFFLNVANWLHANRAKAAWTYIADGYALFLLFLATSGVFMLKGRKGLVGRGAFLIAVGAAVPIIYVTMARGP